MGDKIAGESAPWRDAVGWFVDALSNTEATPGGGSAAGVSAAMGCALGEMAAGISRSNKKIDDARRSSLDDVKARLKALRARLEILTGKDAAAFDGVMAALKTPQDAPDRKEKVQAALVHAGEVPLETAQTSLEALALVRESMSLAVGTVASDMNCAEHLLRASVLCALENVDVNVRSIKDPAAAARLAGPAEEIRKTLSDGSDEPVSGE